MNLELFIGANGRPLLRDATTHEVVENFQIETCSRQTQGPGVVYDIQVRVYSQIVPLSPPPTPAPVPSCFGEEGVEEFEDVQVTPSPFSFSCLEMGGDGGGANRAGDAFLGAVQAQLARRHRGVAGATNYTRSVLREGAMAQSLLLPQQTMNWGTLPGVVRAEAKARDIQEPVSRAPTFQFSDEVFDESSQRQFAVGDLVSDGVDIEFRQIIACQDKPNGSSSPLRVSHRHSTHH